MRNPRDIILRPIVSEKSMEQMAIGKYTFVVAMDSNKTEIKNAVEDIFKVKVRDVNTMRIQGKFRRYGRYSGYRPDWKKAVVTLEEGQRIAFFEGLS